LVLVEAVGKGVGGWEGLSTGKGKMEKGIGKNTEELFRRLSDTPNEQTIAPIHHHQEEQPLSANHLSVIH
jgi:hypothetical protein